VTGERVVLVCMKVGEEDVNSMMSFKMKKQMMTCYVVISQFLHYHDWMCKSTNFMGPGKNLYFLQNTNFCNFLHVHRMTCKSRIFKCDP